VTSHWTDKPVQIYTLDTDWGQTEPAEDSGFDFRARNDSTNLYLMISAKDRDSRSIMRGAYQQDITLWFLGPNGKSKSWALRWAFSSVGHPTSRPEAPLNETGPRTSSTAADERSDAFPPRPDQERSRGLPFEGEHGQIMDPEMVLASGIEISTALPADINFHSESSRREIAYVLSIPLTHLSPMKGRSIPLDFVVSDISAELKERFEAMNRSATGAPGSGMAPGGAMGRGGMGGRMGPGMDGGMMGGGPGQAMGMEIGTDGQNVHGGMTGLSGHGMGGGHDEYTHLSSMRPPTPPEPLNLKLSIRLAEPPAALR